MPDVPTWQEAGLNVAECATFRGWGVPAATPDEAVAELASVIETLAADEGFETQMAESGYDFAYGDSAQMQKVIDNYDQLTSEIIEAAGDDLTSQ